MADLRFQMREAAAAAAKPALPIALGDQLDRRRNPG